MSRKISNDLMLDNICRLMKRKKFIIQSELWFKYKEVIIIACNSIEMYKTSMQFFVCCAIKYNNAKNDELSVIRQRRL